MLIQNLYSQNAIDENKDKISAVLENYFDLEREAIHLHLDKTTFITNEAIWYQGYIINRKTSKPYFTTNVYIVLYDEKGTQLSEKLVFASNGTFSGKIDLKPAMHSGNYYIQVYTNWMNNFSEDESTITKINIINPEEGIKNSKKANSETLEIHLKPEGGNLISGISNSVGVQVKDCRGNSPENLEVSIENGSGTVLKTAKLNRFGLGKFEITPTEEPLKVMLRYSNKTYEKQLPSPEKMGFALAVNNFSIEGKTIIKIKTNSTTSNLLNSKKFYLLVHQDQKSILYDIQFNAELEQVIAINNTELFEGINTLRIIDSDLQQWSERLIYTHPNFKDTATTLVNKNKNNGKIILTGNSPFQNTSMSITILPENTKSYDKDNTIFSGLTINPYLNEPLQNTGYYFNSPGRAQYYELDLALLNQEKSKYIWNYLKTTTPSANYSFDIGVNLKGTIDPKIINKPYHKVKLVSYKDFIMMSADVTEKGDYLFEHILIADSTFVTMSLQKLPNFDIIKTKLNPQVLNRKKPFYKPFKINIPEGCTETESDILVMNDFDIPKFAANVIQLKEVKIKAPAKKSLTYENKLGNGSLRAFKVDETMERQDLLVFIQSNGFDVARSGLHITVYSRNRNSLHAAQPTPEITINGRVLMSHDELGIMDMSEIDEIYLSPYAIVPSIKNNMGVIKIYTKKNIPNAVVKQDINSFYFKEGFARYFGFKNADYENSQSSGFNNYGLLHWASSIVTDENGQFTFEITNYNKPKAKVIIEGITNDGQLFQEEKTIDLQ
ncbi:hypothetical protein [Flavobacterium phycosphaerae]|uniref:hypothetical protein n=1 Tax=Flavobacterium phycosphaerae TaxID=2697515 RepID=UPI0013898579|nr:hypothetical protein [Flavobacterium phycosphaerae]